MFKVIIDIVALIFVTIFYVTFVLCSFVSSTHFLPFVVLTILYEFIFSPFLAYYAFLPLCFLVGCPTLCNIYLQLSKTLYHFMGCTDTL